MATFAPALPAFAPSIPERLDDVGVPQALILDLMLRRLMVEGYSSLNSLSQRLKLSISVLDAVFKHMRAQQMIEVRGMIGNDYSFSLSGAGRALASERFHISQYSGACPVSLDDYTAAVKAQSAQLVIDRARMREAYSDLVIPDEVLDQIGPALISQKSVFLYGPSGNGKTSIAERMLRVYDDSVLIPYAVEVDGQVISLYGPVVHQRLDTPLPDVDPRWVPCRRPCIAVGGELIPSMVELRLDDTSGIYAAPLQMKANNGIFIIDDFGRQLMAPRDLLNRWIVPLDRKVDYLTLRYGVKFQIPFELMVVFSTNLDPRDLADDAFLRRIQNKIFITSVKEDVFDMIFARVARKRGMRFTEECPSYLRELVLRDDRTELRACYPNDICEIIQSISSYEGVAPAIDAPTLERATDLYFGKTEVFEER